MKSLISLLDSMLQECGMRCGTSTRRDRLTISFRAKKEGLGFLSITLGLFADDFERSLSNGRVCTESFRSFSKIGPARKIPRLFSGFLLQIFGKDGVLLDEPSIEAIKCVRQLCRMYKKVEVPCSKERVASSIENYIKVESELSMFDLNKIDDRLWKAFCFSSDVLWNHLGKIDLSKLVPQHGNGAVAEKIHHNQKYFHRTWHHRLEPFFPSDSFCYSSIMGFLEYGSSISYANPEQEHPVRVVHVPKTLKGPRIIGIEPVCMQYTQQALLNEIVDRLETHDLTRGHVNFRDQTINGKLALESSKNGVLATLDLKDASDRVHKDVVYRMLRSAPLVRDAVFACRSMTSVPCEGVKIPLTKFASMGSALCFPIESMVFYTLLVASEIIRLGLPLRKSSIDIVRKRLWVYGDDLIVPVESVPSIVSTLEAFALKVNLQKSFWTGKFRESCGVDAYDGVNITPVYFRRMLPDNRRDVSGLISAVDFANQLYRTGYTNTAALVKDLVSKVVYDVPSGCDNAGYLCWIWDTSSKAKTRWNEKLHVRQIYAYVPVPRKIKDHIDSYPALTKWFLRGMSRDRASYTHRVSSASLTVKRQWRTQLPVAPKNKELHSVILSGASAN